MVDKKAAVLHSCLAPNVFSSDMSLTNDQSALHNSERKPAPSPNNLEPVGYSPHCSKMRHTFQTEDGGETQQRSSPKQYPKRDERTETLEA